MKVGKRLLVGLCSFVCAATIVGAVHRRPGSAVFARYTTGVGAQVSPLARALRPNYPYSVIPGGAYSPAELRGAVGHDSGVRQHYSGFDLSKARLVKLTDDRFAFVSFRQNNRFFWTRRRLRIAKGEILLTDGRNYAKTRCGNRLSDVPVGQNAAEELPSIVLSPPLLEARQLPDLSFVDAPATELAAQESPELSPELSPESPVLPASSLAGPQPTSSAFAATPAGPEFGAFGGGGIGPSSAAASGHKQAAELIMPLSPQQFLLPAPEPSRLGAVAIAICCLALLTLSRQRR